MSHAASPPAGATHTLTPSPTRTHRPPLGSAHRRARTPQPAPTPIRTRTRGRVGAAPAVGLPALGRPVPFPLHPGPAHRGGWCRRCRAVRPAAATCRRRPGKGQRRPGRGQRPRLISWQSRERFGRRSREAGPDYSSRAGEHNPSPSPSAGLEYFVPAAQTIFNSCPLPCRHRGASGCQNGARRRRPGSVRPQGTSGERPLRKPHSRGPRGAARRS